MYTFYSISLESYEAEIYASYESTHAISLQEKPGERQFPRLPSSTPPPPLLPPKTRKPVTSETGNQPETRSHQLLLLPAAAAPYAPETAAGPTTADHNTKREQLELVDESGGALRAENSTGVVGENYSIFSDDKICRLISVIFVNISSQLGW